MYVHTLNKESKDGVKVIDFDEIFSENYSVNLFMKDEIPVHSVSIKNFTSTCLAYNPRTASNGVVLYDFYTFKGWGKDFYGQEHPSIPLSLGPVLYAIPLCFNQVETLNIDNGILVEPGNKIVFLGETFKTVHGLTRLAFEHVKEI